MRTHINIMDDKEEKDENGRKKKNNRTGGRPYAILKHCSFYASKVLLLTATPLVNTPHDINNLLAMIDGRMPTNSKVFSRSI